MKPITDYAADCSRWQDWQHAYRYGALYIFPSSKLRARFNELRRRLDPESQAVCDAHISLTVPFPRVLTPADWQALTNEMAAVPALQLQYGAPYQFPGVPGVVLLIEPADSIRELVRQLEAGAVFQGAAPRKYRFTPHLTLAENVSLERSAALVHELKDEVPTGSFGCTELAYAVPDECFHFSERSFLQLGSSAP